MTGRHITTAVTMTVLVVVLIVMAAIGFRQLTAPFPSTEDTASGAESCTPLPSSGKTFAFRRDIVVSVFNTSEKAGLAGDTLAKLERRNFKAGAVGNASPTGVNVRRVVVHTTTENDPAAALVAANLGKNVRIVVDDEGYGPGVDVFVARNIQLRADPPFRMRIPDNVSSCAPSPSAAS